MIRYKGAQSKQVGEIFIQAFLSVLQVYAYEVITFLASKANLKQAQMKSSPHINQYWFIFSNLNSQFSLPYSRAFVLLNAGQAWEIRKIYIRLTKLISYQYF